MHCARIVATAGLVLATRGPATAEYRQVEVKDGGTITGKVVLSGKAPVLPPQPVYKKKEYCGTTVLDERLVVGKGGTVQNAVVYLDGVSEGKRIDDSKPVVLNNYKCAFVPHVLSASLGQTLEIHNSDPFVHDAHARIGTRTLFNRGIPRGRTVREKLTEPGLIHINCNVRHTWMHCYLYVGDNPYHAVTGPNGSFTLQDVPPGHYTLKVWHEMLGGEDRQVDVHSGETTTVTFELVPEVTNKRPPGEE
jgi:plastocyanin